MIRRLSLFALLINLSLLSASRPYVTVKLTGQLCNQMFCIAAAYSLALDHGADLLIPDLIERREDGTYDNYRHVFFRCNTSPLPNPVATTYRESTFDYHPIPYSPNILLQNSFFQCAKHFDRHRSQILDLFAPSQTLLNTLQARHKEILQHPCSVAVHVRKYHGSSQKLHQVADADYYLKAMSRFPSDALFVICSNEISWCKRAFANAPYKIKYIENEPRWNDLYLMSMCHHHILSNSSFSWWSAYLNQNPSKRVIAPFPWCRPNIGFTGKDVPMPEWEIIHIDIGE